jgi:hypothetical protein
MKWKRSRKAQQEAKSKDHSSSNSSNNNNNNNEEKPRERNISTVPVSQPPIQTFTIPKAVMNEKVITNLTNNNNFHFSKDQNSHHPPHPQSLVGRHIGLMNGNPKDFISNGIDENNTNNLLNRQTILFNENSQNDDMIWRVV